MVVYLRELYFPEGFAFPLKIMPLKLSLVEIGREVATIFMLLSVSYIASKNRWSRFAYFMIAFGVWDIWYYLWLKIIINWPASFLTWDVLFLIPAPWVGPVLAPVIVSISLIAAGVIILYLQQAGYDVSLKKWEWLVVVSAGLIVFTSFILQSTVVMKSGVPESYNWYVFAFGEALGLFILVNGWRRKGLSQKSERNR
ncbi:hypothetical protein L0Z72_14250 [candidate division KSB1 bacterium]|nr:hypothetical protein [candidate division KSB1 bacterium]